MPLVILLTEVTSNPEGGRKMADKGKAKKKAKDADKDKVKVSLFVEPEVARAMKVQAARQGAEGVSKLVGSFFLCSHCGEAITDGLVVGIGREKYRTTLALLDIAEAGCRIFTYADGQEVKLDTPISKQMVSMRNYAAEDYREQIANKTKEAMRAKAKAGHVVGKRTYG